MAPPGTRAIATTATALGTPAADRRTDHGARLIADPGHAPELLAMAAVETFGPTARAWADRTRATYPAATPQGLARLATARFARAGSVAAVVGGLLGPYGVIGAAAFTQAELVLHLAAAYGLDPTDSERAADLLVLAGVHADKAEAEAALAAARVPADDEGGFADAASRLGRLLLAPAGAWSVVRLVNRYLPGVAVLASALAGHASASMAAARATTYFRKDSQSSGSTV